MATIKILGTTAAIVSAFTRDQLEELEKYRPEALKIKDAETKEDVFMVAFDEDEDSVSPYGISFGGVTNGETKYAMCTLPIPSGTEDPAKYVAEEVGTSIIMLNRLEATLGDVLTEITAEKKAVADSISIVL